MFFMRSGRPAVEIVEESLVANKIVQNSTPVIHKLQTEANQFNKEIHCNNDSFRRSNSIISNNDNFKFLKLMISFSHHIKFLQTILLKIVLNKRFQFINGILNFRVIQTH